MDEAAFHQQMNDLYQRQKAEPRPRGTDPEVWRNRYLVKAKLSRELYLSFQQFCKDRDLSFNRGLKFLLSTHPLIKTDG